MIPAAAQPAAVGDTTDRIEMNSGDVSRGILKHRNVGFSKLNSLNRTEMLKRATGVVMPLTDGNGNIVYLIAAMDGFKQ